MDIYIVNFDLFNGMYTEKDINIILSCSSVNEAIDFVKSYYAIDKEYKVEIKSCKLWEKDNFLITSAKPYRISEKYDFSY